MTRLIQLANNAVSYLVSGISDTDVSCTVNPGDGAKFPSLGSGKFFMATLAKSTGELEVVKVTARATDTFTIARAAEPVAGVAAPFSFSAGDRIEMRFTSGGVGNEFDRIDSAAFTSVSNKTANYTIVANDISNLIRVDTTTGNKIITLPLISGLADDFMVLVSKISTDLNRAVVTCSGSNRVNGATTYPLTAQWQSAWLIADRGSNTWTAINSGESGQNTIVDSFVGDGTTGPFVLSGGPVSKNNTLFYIDGEYQEKSTYTLDNQDVTPLVAVAVGAKVEIVWFTPVRIVNKDYISAADYGKSGGNTIENLVGIEGSEGAVYEAVAYFNGWSASTTPLGGGTFVKNSTLAKSNHNGGTVISHTVPRSGTQEDYLNGVGETDPSGLGCWVRVGSESGVSISHFGGRLDGDDDSAALQALLNWLPDHSKVEIPFGSSIGLGLGAQVDFSKPIAFICHANMQLLGSTTLGTPIIKVTTDDAKLDFRGPINGNDTNWSFLQADRTDRCIRNVEVDINWIEELNSSQVSVSQFVLAFQSVIGGRFSIRGRELGGYGVYVNFCQNVFGEEIILNRVNHTGISCSANIGCTMGKVRVYEIGYFGTKGGYGIAGTISSHTTPTSTTFSIAKTSANILKWKAGQEFVVIRSTTSCLFPKVKTIVEFSDYLLITTSEEMLAVPVAGMDLQILDGTRWADIVSDWTGDNVGDFNGVGAGFVVEKARSKFAGRYIGFGAGRLTLGTWWIGYDPQGANQGFLVNNIEVLDVVAENSAGCAVELFSIGENVTIRGKGRNCCELMTRLDGSFVANDPSPEKGGASVNMLTFQPCKNVNIDFDYFAKNGALHLLNFCLYATLKGLGNSGSGVVIEDAVGGVELNNVTAVSNSPGGSALEIRKGSQTSNDVRVVGGRLQANGAGSMALNVSADNATNILISELTKLEVEASGILVANNSANAFSSPKYANLPVNVPLVVGIGQAISCGAKCIVAAGASQEVCRIVADNGTNGLIDLVGSAWQQTTGAKESFAVFAQGDNGTVLSTTPVFTSKGSINATQFMDKDSGGTPIRDWTLATNSVGFRLIYTNHTANTVNLDMLVTGISRT